MLIKMNQNVIKSPGKNTAKIKANYHLVHLKTLSKLNYSFILMNHLDYVFDKSFNVVDDVFVVADLF